MTTWESSKVSVAALRNELDELVSRVEDGGHVIYVTRRGEPVAALVTVGVADGLMNVRNEKKTIVDTAGAILRTSAVGVAAAWLTQFMEEQRRSGTVWIRASIVHAACRDTGFPMRTVQRAANEIRIVRVRRSGGRGKTPIAWWALADTDRTTAPRYGSNDI